MSETTMTEADRRALYAKCHETTAHLVPTYWPVLSCAISLKHIPDDISVPEAVIAARQIRTESKGTLKDYVAQLISAEVDKATGTDRTTELAVIHNIMRGLTLKVSEDLRAIATRHPRIEHETR